MADVPWRLSFPKPRLRPTRGLSMPNIEVGESIGKVPLCRACGTRMPLVQRTPRTCAYELRTFECPGCKDVKCVAHPPSGRRGGKRFRVEERIAETEFRISRQQELISSDLAGDPRKAVELVQVLQTILVSLREARDTYERRHIADQTDDFTGRKNVSNNRQ
ncbi:hypothetical protein [Vineibacter terrae]|uniref:hypothetical protein n=1 Tax=Vineibacter terrae TaxID=2586908 RepID=UPI002E300112|nr:hypothetical protein [Vineibacter terrae]HEX2886056.1 hypothetical protein [Vineibacter terrae]